MGDGAAGLTVPRGASGPQTVTGDGAVVLTVPRGVPVPQREAGKGAVGLSVPRAVARGPLSRGRGFDGVAGDGRWLRAFSDGWGCCWGHGRQCMLW